MRLRTCHDGLEPIIASFVVCDHLTDDQLTECLVMREVIQHTAESSDKREEFVRALENRLLRIICPLRVLLESIVLSKRLGTKFCKGFFELWEENVDEEVIEE